MAFTAPSLQGKTQSPPVVKPRGTGRLPARLASGIQSLSGVDLSSVPIHRNSSEPERLGANAYARAGEIHLGPGQDRHLPEEAWHLVQQAQGRVQATTQMHVNDDAGLEHEAAAMGARAASQPVAQLNKNKGRKKKEEKRRQAAIDRLDRGRPDSYSHLDPVVERRLERLDRRQPRKTATRRNIETYDQRQREAPAPSVVEVGAGEGRFSAPFSKKFGRGYVATDIASKQGPTGFLGSARGVRTTFGINANELGQHFRPGSLSHVVGANPFGAKGVKGASYGLRSENPEGVGKKKWEPDQRFLTSARPLLKPGGSVELYGRSNILREQEVAKVPSTGKKGARTHQEQQQVAAAKLKYPGENANPYLETTPSQLRTLAKDTGYRVRVKKAKQPARTSKGGNPDTKLRGDEAERAATGLKPFNTRFSFTPAEEGYKSDDDDPRVRYESDDESDWED